MNTQVNFAKFGKRMAMAATLGALCFLAGVPRAQAQDGRSCRFRVERAEARLRDAIEDHGYYSRQAYDRRRDLSYEQQLCWNQFQGYSFSYSYNNQWRGDRDGDRDGRYFRDRDRDRDRGRDHDRDRGRDGGRNRDDHFRDHDSR
jgi:hypothetical protein